ncbi:Crp/Fnr family transcriptional regulator [Aurantimonas endophytica]|uniref:CRP-like cAMP-binding protein n=1 Tax=Aurantimonas endophytica TaxID=1522175 RepID=A0A7W6MPN4_9HYPH|nr:Crp/Fnr family transcriptional regulator [Aurantimonas endophytica]MBB4003195.1 CRP-like cAMP-binding protein [Aurantimonas endophytica]MCO6404060.1 helix-turn-helix domain-containing protein [Aurantimonas endophytica]
MLSSSAPAEILIKRLHRSTGLDETELADLRTLPATLREIGKNETISREGDRVHQCVLIIDGFLARFLDTREGKRQILSFYVPGDIPDLQSLHLPTMDHSLGSIAPSRIAMIPHQALAEVSGRNPRIASALWRETLIDGSVTRRWVRCLGRLNARQRVAHMLCELYVRLEAVGLADRPIRLMTQQDIGDAMGLTVVQINRTLRDLRSEGLIRVEKRHLTIVHRERLQKIAEFDPFYLHLDPEARS